MSLKVPYTDNLAINAKLPGQVTADFKEAEHEDARDDAKLDQEIKDRKDADSHLQGQIDKLNERVGTLESQVQQLQENDKDHEKRLKRIEELLFGSQPINASTVTVDDDSEHQGYDVADAPDYDYQEQEIN